MKLGESIRGTIFEDAIWWWKIKQLETKTIHVETEFADFDMEIPVGTNLERLLEEEGAYEPVLAQALALNFTTDTVYYDIGSRWGYFTLFANNFIRKGEVHAFDANPKWLHILRRNHDEKETILNNIYVSDRSGPRTTTIDDYLLDALVPDIVKIDIEGAEAAAVRGMASLLERHQPKLYIEVHPKYLQKYDDSTSSLLDALPSIYDINVAPDHRNGESKWVPLNDAVLPDSGDYLIRAQ